MDSIVSSTDEFSMLLRVLTSNNNTIKPQRKRVCISAEISFSAPSDLTRDEVKSLWYDSQKLSGFKSKARKMIFSKNVEQQETTRGLESCTLERQLQRRKTVQCILSSYKKGMTAEQTAMVSQRCGAWNRNFAVLQACHDYFEVHQPNVPLPTLDNTPPEFPFQLKRAANSNDQPRRRVRRRTTA
jgi:hypothetical protein